MAVDRITTVNVMSVSAQRRRCPAVRLLITLLCTVLLLPLPATGTTPETAQLEQQRQQFQAARQALKAGGLDEFRRLTAQLQDYPLYPYLRHDYIRDRLRQLPDEEIAAFLQAHPDLPVTDALRNRWLDQLASRGRWQTYIDHYNQPNDNRLRCLYLIARMKTGQSEGLLEAIRGMWLVGYSQHDACDPAFAKLESSPLMDDDLVWQRIRLAIDNNETGLAGYLARKLDNDGARRLAEQWLTAHRQPDSVLRDPAIADTTRGREVILHGLRRLSRHSLQTALTRWQALEPRYDFSTAERDGLVRDLAVRAAADKHEAAGRLLGKVATDRVDSTVFIYRLRHALGNNNWQQLREWTTAAPPADVDAYQWRYWHARALERLGDADAAHDIYHKLATERDFYGFLAADRLGIDYHMNHFPVPIADEQLQKVAELPAVRRAFEFLELGEQYPARREWHHALTRMTSYQMQAAAQLASERDWHDRAILALGRAKAYDNLEQRFPVIHRDALENHARKHDLDMAWVYALIRAESAFWEDARSPAGALGLMQVMPATGRDTARRIGLNNFSTSQLLEPEYNIPIGSYYLKKMYDEFRGNMILATAAYNAGPSRVKSWLPKAGCIEPDVWIENIPFYETRGYVKRVLSYASIYDWRLENGHRPLSQRMASVAPLQKSDTLMSGLTCEAGSLTMNE